MKELISEKETVEINFPCKTCATGIGCEDCAEIKAWRNSRAPKDDTVELPYGMEMGKTYKFTYGVDDDLNLVRERIEDDEE